MAQLHNPRPGDRASRLVLVGHDRGHDVTVLQPLTVLRVNRVTVTVRTDQGSVLRLLPEDLRDPIPED